MIKNDAEKQCHKTEYQIRQTKNNLVTNKNNK